MGRVLVGDLYDFPSAPTINGYIPPPPPPVQDNTGFSYSTKILADAGDFAGVVFTPKVNCKLKSVSRFNKSFTLPTYMRLYRESDKQLLASTAMGNELTALFDYDLTAGVTYIIGTYNGDASWWYYNWNHTGIYPVNGTNVDFIVSIKYDDSASSWINSSNNQGWDISNIITEA